MAIDNVMLVARSKLSYFYLGASDIPATQYSIVIGIAPLSHKRPPSVSGYSDFRHYGFFFNIGERSMVQALAKTNVFTMPKHVLFIMYHCLCSQSDYVVLLIGKRSGPFSILLNQLYVNTTAFLFESVFL